MDRAQRHHAMVDFQQHQQRLWVVLEEDHEKVEQRAALLEGLLREMLEAYDDGVGREDEHGNNWEFPLWQKVHAALAGQLPAAEHPFAKRLREAGPQIAAEVDRMIAATPSEDGREVQDERDIMLAEAREVLGYCIDQGDLPMELQWMAERVSKGRRLYVDDRALVAHHSRIVAAKDAEIEAYRVALIQARAQPGDGWPKLDQPAKVGAARFMAGVSARLVVEAAQRQYAHDVTPEKEAERIAKADALVASLRRAELAPAAVALPAFPTMLRKMWSGGEVQQWIENNAHTIPVAELEALRRDAGRYRFLRLRIATSQLRVLGAECTSDTVEGVDAGIDTAIAQQQEGVSHE